MEREREGKISGGATHLNQASAAWASAERDARNAAAAKTRFADVAPRRETPAAPPPAAVTQAAPTPPPVSSQAIPSPTASPQPAQTAPATAAPAPKAVANPTVEIEAIVATYARAIESRDVAEVRRAYPGATQAQLKGFDEFFKTLRSMRVSFSVGSLDVQGDAADARLSGAYDYV